MTDLLERPLVVPAESPTAHGIDDLSLMLRRGRPTAWPSGARLAVALLALTSLVGGVGWARAARSDERRVTELQSQIVQLKADAAARAGRIDQLMWAIDELEFQESGSPDVIGQD